MATSFDVAKDYLERVQHALDNPVDIPGIPYGIRSVDEMTGGILENELTILGGETGAGKSLLLGQLSLNVAKWLKVNQPDKVVRIIHCEMPLWQVQERLTHLLAGVPSKKVREGKITPEEFEKIKAANAEIAKLPIEYRADPQNIQEVAEFIREDNACAWWAIDHIQDLEVGRGDLSPIDTKAMQLKTKLCAALTREVCSGMILSQFTNEVGKREDHRPTKADLFGGKMLQSPASVIMLLYCEFMYQVLSEDRRREPKPCYLIVDKNRGGDRGDIKVIFNPAKGAFLDTGIKVKE